jgi:hypothetical protein
MLENVMVKLKRGERLGLTISLIKRDSLKVILFQTCLSDYVYTLLQKKKTKMRSVLACNDGTVLSEIFVAAKLLKDC